jgi:hypothetical protein
MSGNQTVTPELVPVLTVFRRLGISKTKGWQLIMSGQLQSMKIGRRSYSKEDWIADFIVRNARKPTGL